MNFNLKTIKSSGLLGGLKKMLDTNAPTVATFGSVLSLGLTMFFMHKASKAAAKISEKYDEQLAELEIYRVDEDEDKTVEDGAIDDSEYKTEKARIKMNKALSLVWVYRYAIVAGVASGGLAFLSNYLNGRTIATITGALALSHDKLKTYMEKGKEMLGDEKFEQLRNEINSEMLGNKVERGEFKAEQSKLIASEKADPDEGCERFYIPYSDEFWDMPEGCLRDALAEAERMEYLSFNDFRNMCGYGSSQIGSKVKWDFRNKFKAHIGYVNIGIGGMKALIFDNEPDFDMMGK